MVKFNVSIDAVQAGQKSNVVNAEPTLTANSTNGKFQVTGTVSKDLNVAVGENIQFFNNIKGLEDLAKNPNDDVRQFCDENGFDLNTIEGKQAFVDSCTTWFIAKGHQMFNTDGTPMMTAIRCSKEDKEAAIEMRGAELVQDATLRAKLIERVGNEDATDEELVEALTIDDIPSPVTEKFAGSKTATSGQATGVGCILNFTDTTIWNAMKKDLGDIKDKKNRIYKVRLDMPKATTVHNGREHIEVTAYPLEFVEDVDPIVRKKSEDAE